MPMTLHAESTDGGAASRAFTQHRVVVDPLIGLGSRSL
jgi:hypothetical protein